MDFANIISNSRHITLRKTPIENKYGRYWNFMRWIVLAQLGTMRSRSGMYTDPWHTAHDTRFDLPALITINDSLADLIDQRAVELHTLACQTNRDLYIMWSGGIDSTAVLVSFLKNLSTAEHQRLVIVLTEDSIAENPAMYAAHIQDKLRTVSYYEFTITNEFLSTQGIVLSGDPGDALFGPSSSMYEHLMADKKHHLPFKDNTNIIAKSIDMRTANIIQEHKLFGFGQWYANKITDNLLEVQPAGVESIADWWWWHYINFKWESSIWRPIIRRKYTTPTDVLEPSTVTEFVNNTFFNTPKFQQWSWTNLKRLIGDDLSKHKIDAREYIRAFDHNEDYYHNKKKIESVPARDDVRIVQNMRRPTVWTDSWVGLYDDENPELIRACVDLLENYKG